MTAVALGPYEHTGAYVGSELFDTSGTPGNFCDVCEHAPCVAQGFSPGCSESPREIGAIRMCAEIYRRYTAAHGYEEWLLIEDAFHTLSAFARVDTGRTASSMSMRALARVASNLREEAQS